MSFPSSSGFVTSSKPAGGSSYSAVSHAIVYEIETCLMAESVNPGSA